MLLTSFLEINANLQFTRPLLKSIFRCHLYIKKTHNKIKYDIISNIKVKVLSE